MLIVQHDDEEHSQEREEWHIQVADIWLSVRHTWDRIIVKQWRGKGSRRGTLEMGEVRDRAFIDIYRIQAHVGYEDVPRGQEIPTRDFELL